MFKSLCSLLLLMVSMAALAQAPPAAPNSVFMCEQNGEGTCACAYAKTITCSTDCSTGWQVTASTCTGQGQPCPWNYYGTDNQTVSIELAKGVCYEWIRFYRVKTVPVAVPVCTNGQCPSLTVPFDGFHVQYGPAVACEDPSGGGN